MKQYIAFVYMLICVLACIFIFVFLNVMFSEILKLWPYVDLMSFSNGRINSYLVNGVDV